MTTEQKVIEILISFGLLHPRLRDAQEYLTLRRKKKPAVKLELTNEFPIPTDGRGGRSNVGRKYNFEDFEIGQSAWIPLSQDNTFDVKEILERIENNTNWIFVTRSVSKSGLKNNEVGEHMRGTRVWRVE